MSTPAHEHVFRVATVRDSQGKALEGGRRCSCGVEVRVIPFRPDRVAHHRGELPTSVPVISCPRVSHSGA